MLTLRDHDSAAPSDLRIQLGAKRKQLLDRSWAGVFRDYLLLELPVGELAPHFSKDFGRPSKDLHVVLGALLLQQLHDLTDAQTVEAIAFNIAWQYALDVRSEADCYFCERTLRTYRRLVIQHHLDEVLFQSLTDKLIASVGVNTRKQRIDSTGVRSFMRNLTRLGILVESTSKFLRELRRTSPLLYQGLDPELWRKYVARTGDGCFALTTPSQSKCRLLEAAADIDALLRQFYPTEAARLDSYRLLERVFEEQCERIEEASGQSSIQIRDPNTISCDNILNPADPDASYNKRRGVGYLVQVMETFSEDPDTDQQAEEATSAVSKVAKPDLITHMAVGKMTVHDSKALLPAIEDTEARGVAPEHMVADTHYGSTKCLTQAKAKGVTLLAPAMSPKGKGQGKLTLEDFELDTSGHIQRCPAGYAPLETSVSKKRLQARFALNVCGQCPLQTRCPIHGKERLQYTHDRVKQRARRLSQQSPAFRDRYRWRAGIEGTMSRLKHQMGLARLRVRGQGAVQYRVLLRALGLNIHRVAAWRGSFYPQKLFGRLLSALRCHQRVPGLGKPIPGSTNRRFEAPTTRVCRWLSPLLSRLFAALSTFDNISKGLYAALTKALGGYVVIQRCQWHKRENVTSYLPKGKQDEIKKALQNAYDLPTYREAKAALDALKPELTLINEDVTKSLEEGLEETLSLHRLRLMPQLKQSFRTTNCIESLNSMVAQLTRNVKRWTNSNQRSRWLATALLDIEPRLRRIKGFRCLPRLRLALQNDLKLDTDWQDAFAAD